MGRASLALNQKIFCADAKEVALLQKKLYGCSKIRVNCPEFRRESGWAIHQWLE
jgi:hypothetical protein